MRKYNVAVKNGGLPLLRITLFVARITLFVLRITLFVARITLFVLRITLFVFSGTTKDVWLVLSNHTLIVDNIAPIMIFEKDQT